MRAARGLLDWTQGRLAEASGVALSTIKRMESAGPEKSSVENLDKVSTALEVGGITFVGQGEPSTSGGPGVRLKGGKPDAD